MLLAERAGFEPALGYYPKHAFQACDLNRSSTSPEIFDGLFSQPKKVREDTREARPQQVVYLASLYQPGKNGIISN